MRVLVIDDSPAFREQAVPYLAAAMPGAQVAPRAPVAQGKAGVGFDWRGFDALILEDPPGPGQDGLEWLRELRAEGHVPPTLVVAEAGGENLTVKAISAGAVDYLKKSDVTPIRLAMAIKEAMIEAASIARNAESLRVTQQLRVAEIGQ